jgi:hypothetical protein
VLLEYRKRVAAYVAQLQPNGQLVQIFDLADFKLSASGPEALQFVKATV